MKLDLKSAFYRLKNKINLQFIKLSWIDLKRDKAKAIFGISGIAVSLFLLTAIGMLNDTMSYNYVRMITNTTGAADIMITRTIKTDLTYDPFFDEDIIDDKLHDIEGVEELFPRVMMLVKTSSERTTSNGTLEMYGLDFEKEFDNGHLGDLIVADEDGNETDELYDGTPNDGECVLLWKASELLNVTKDGFIHLQYQQYTLDLKVVEICIQDLKFMQFETALILVNLDQAQQFLNREGKINMIMGTIENPEQIYDASNMDETTRKLRAIGSRIQERLDINDYTVALPKLEELEGGEFLLMGTTIIFWFITILSMLITGILINSILSTSVEERIREFGILRVVGGKKSFPLKMVLFEGMLLGLFGSIIGIVLGAIFTEPIALTVFTLVGGFEDFEGLEFVLLPQTVLLGATIGIAVSFLVAMLPALRTSRMNLIKSITPFRSKEEGWEVAKEGSMNTKSFLIGISIATIGMIIFVLLPRIFTTGNIMLIAALFIGLLSAILIGLVFASVGIIPLIQQLFASLISPGIKKYGHIIKISLKRYRRRNTSTIVMFAISFSFIFYITGTSEMQADNMEVNLEFQYGSDLVVVNQGSSEDNTGVTVQMVDELKTLEGVDKTAYVLHNTFDIQAALSILMGVSEEGMGFQEESTESQFTALFNYYAKQFQTKYRVEIADISNHDNCEVGLIGADQDFLDLIDHDQLIWKSAESNTDDSFNSIFENNNTCIIAAAIASVLGIEEVGTEVRVTFFNPQIEDDPGNITIFKIVGISGGIPGFWNFRSSEFSADGGGMMISRDNYIRLMDVPNAGTTEMLVDKIFINLNNNSEANIKKTKEDIQSMYKDKSFVVDDAISKINYIREMNDRQNLIMEVILMFTVIICLFGLISSMYSVMLERTFEIGILRSMGLKARNVRNMFLLESMIVMLSAGIMGTIIGSYCAYLMETNLGLLTEMPVIFAIPMDTLLRTFIISVSVGIVGMYIVLIKISRQSIMDIFRRTF